MATLTIDTHAFIERLRAAGMADAQAKAVVEGLREIDLHGVATKQDLSEVESRLRVEIANAKTDMMKFLFPVLLAQAGLIVTLVKLL